MTEVLLSIGIFIALFFLMSIGYIFAQKVLTGTCGGIGAMMGKCDICEKKVECKYTKE